MGGIKDFLIFYRKHIDEYHAYDQLFSIRDIKVGTSKSGTSKSQKYHGSHQTNDYVQIVKKLGQSGSMAGRALEL